MDVMFATIYEWKPYTTKQEVAEIMAQYAELGDIPSVIAHYVRREGTGGIVISDEMPEYSRSLAWGRYLRWECIPIDDVGAILPDVQAYIS
jgi:hypothetical protein